MTGVLDTALEAHGGIERWQWVRALTARASLGGALLAMKGRPEGLRDVGVWADATRPWMVCAPFPEAGQRGIFEKSRVSTETVDGKQVTVRQEARAECVGMPLDASWDHLQLLYFASYAIWNHLCLPFLLARPDIDSREINAWEVEDGMHWRRLFVRFPPGFPTHCEEQVLYFDKSGLLRRIDYVAEVAGTGAMPLAHYCLDHAIFDGLVFPTRQVAFAKDADGRPGAEPMISLELADIRAS